MLLVYVDGTFYNGRYGGGYVVIQDNPYKIVYQDCGIGIQDEELISMRNISGEMSAAMHATNWLYKNNHKGIIIHDYIGLSKWVTGEWKTNKKYTKMYAECMRQFYPNIITFQWVKGHSKVEGNDIADRLARQAVQFNQQWQFN